MDNMGLTGNTNAMLDLAEIHEIYRRSSLTGTPHIISLIIHAFISLSVAAGIPNDAPLRVMAYIT